MTKLFLTTVKTTLTVTVMAGVFIGHVATVDHVVTSLMHADQLARTTMKVLPAATHRRRSHCNQTHTHTLRLSARNNNNNNNHDDIYSAVIMTRSLREFTRFIW